MNIAFISTIFNFPWGGADALWTKAAEAAQLRGDRILLALSQATAAHQRVAALVHNGASLHLHPTPGPAPTFLHRVARKARSLLHTPEPLFPVLESFRPDLIIFSQGGTYDVAIHPGWVRWLVDSKIPFRLIANWQQEHPSLTPEQWDLARGFLPHADRLFFVSQRNLDNTRRHLLLPLPNASALHNPLRWTPADASPWPDSSTPRLATVSRLDHVKGLHLLLHALAEARLPGWLLTVHGTGPAFSYLQDTANYLGLAPRVTFAGHVESLRSIWENHHLMVSPALDEGVPMTIPEAMLCGRPALATNVGGAADWITHQQTGFLCPAPTVPLLAQSLQEAFAAFNHWPDIGQAASQTARHHYRPDDYLRILP